MCHVGCIKTLMFAITSLYSSVFSPDTPTMAVLAENPMSTGWEKRRVPLCFRPLYQIQGQEASQTEFYFSIFRLSPRQWWILCLKVLRPLMAAYPCHNSSTVFVRRCGIISWSFLFLHTIVRSFCYTWFNLSKITKYGALQFFLLSKGKHFSGSGSFQPYNCCHSTNCRVVLFCEKTQFILQRMLLNILILEMWLFVYLFFIVSFSYACI